jgi:hypothetical protein
MTDNTHRNLAPILFDFIPEGRSATDVALYKVMRRITRTKRQQLWDATSRCLRDCFTTGTGYFNAKEIFNEPGTTGIG